MQVNVQGSAVMDNGAASNGQQSETDVLAGGRGGSHEEKKTNRFFFAMNIGFFAGVLWGGIKIVEFYFHFTSVIPSFLAEPFYRTDFLLTWQGLLIGWLFFVLFSVIASCIYMLLLSKIKGPWVGIGYGIVWWCLLYLAIGPWTGMMGWLYYSEWNTIITDFCLFLLWGLFIGYSIAFEFTQENSRKP
ncbi:YqhR family membrane protein [Paenibacillus lutrae]|uniref:Uncharacterized protein n=1 Tax=Paenibacillus lutrae TaxID=2078573 RepID=A0A7X3FI95_9BACL|nr:YqhR family membrane protein [Paenibacillus lutrae]MVP00178.1 hypothetical protein [Paenibacillus lutrae]